MPDNRPAPARFDPALQAWVLSRHADVSAALRDPRLGAVDSADQHDAHVAVRDAVAQALAADRLDSWQPEFEHSALERAAALPLDTPVDLLAAFASPWALSLAVTVTGASAAAAPDLARLAREVFLAAAHRTDGTSGRESNAAAAELARRLPAPALVSVQTFVALSQTLPHLLGALWLELFAEPAAARRGREGGHLTARILEEGLRLAGPARAVFRHALADVRVGGADIRAGDRVVLALAVANRDPERYPEPDRLDGDRVARDHLAFGAGAHACAGARLIRSAAALATDALLRTTDAIELVGPVTWVDGFAIRAPASLHALLRRVQQRRPGLAAGPGPC